MFKIIGLHISELDSQNKDIKSNIVFGETAEDGTSFDLRKKYFNYQKNLKNHNNFYILDNNYICEEINETEIIFNYIDTEVDLYSFGHIDISCNAIVGKNGSGKSSLVEIIYLMIYNLSVKMKVLNPTYPTKKRAELHYMPYLKAKLMYKDDKGVKMLDFDISEWNDNHSKNSIQFYIGEVENERIKFDLTNDQITLFKLEDFCYSIGMNYSVFGLNNELIGDWIQQLFHKNDGYQTPIVLNPYKEYGQYNIFNEINLNKERLILNSFLFNPENLTQYVSTDYTLGNVDYFFIPGNKKIKNNSNDDFNKCLLKNTKSKPISEFNEYIGKKYLPIKVIEDSQYNGEDDETISFGKHQPDLISFFSFQCSSKSQNKIIREILTQLLDLNALKAEYKKNATNHDLINELLSYIIYKIYRIGYTYSSFFPEVIDENSTGLNRSICVRSEDKKSVIETLMSDNSHKTLKLRRAILFAYNLSNLRPQITFNTGQILYRLDDEHFSNIKKKTIAGLHVDELTYLLPSLFTLQINLIRKSDKNKTPIVIENLSSGELQLILSIHTLLYHILNVNSNHPISEGDKNGAYYTYKNILVLLDEVELYFHPDYQKAYIFELINLLKSFQSNIPKIKSIQFIFSTHSPFILSDISSQFVLKLNNGKQEPHDSQENSFAANIHNLLKDEFFLTDGVMGKYAKHWVKGLIEEIDQLKKYDKSKIISISQKIDLIGEELIRNAVDRLLKDKIQNPMDKIEYLEHQISMIKLENEKNQNNKVTK